MPQYCLIKHRIENVTIDGADPDRNPDRNPVTGMVTFTPLLGKGDAVLITENGQKTTLTLAPIEARITNGELWHRGEPGVKLFAGGPDSNPERIRYRAKFENLIGGGKKVELKDTVFEAAPGGEMELSTVQPAPAQPYPGYTPSMEAAISEISAVRDSSIDYATTKIGEYRDEVLDEADLAIQAAKDANTVPRVTALEALGGLSPESPVDGQTANLIAQPSTLTRDALYPVIAESFPANLETWSPYGQNSRYKPRGTVDTPAGLVPLRARLLLAKNSPVVIVFAGSSTTQGGGIGGGSNGFVSLLAGNHPYIQNHVVENIPTTFDNGITVINMAMGGAWRGNYIRENEAPIVGGWNPALVFHAVGSNDSVSVINPDDLARFIGYRIDEIDEAANLPVGHVIMHQHARNDGSHATPWDSFLPGLYELARTRDNVTVLDLSATFRAVGIPGTDPFGLLNSDQFHVNIEGHKFYADILRPIFNLPEYVPPVPVLFDDFNRADGPLEGSTPTESNGSAWKVITGTYNIDAGKMVPGDVSSTAVIDVGVHDMDLTVDYVRGTRNLSLVLFSDGLTTGGDLNNACTLEMGPTYMTLRRYVDGERSNVKVGYIPITEGTLYEIKVTLRENICTVYLDGTFVMDWEIEAEEVGLTFHGARGRIGGNSFDNFRVTTPGE